MRRAPMVLAATVAGTVALLEFHPHRAATSVAGAPAAKVAGSRTVDGSVVSTRYGPVRVRVTVRAGRVVDVSAMELPANDPRSSQINSFAGPILRQEALKAQSASIDVVSGATFTSDGYQASLQSALSKAGV